MILKKLENPKTLCIICLSICLISFITLLVCFYSQVGLYYDPMYFVRLSIRNMFNFTGLLIPTIYFSIMLFKKKVKQINFLHILLIFQMLYVMLINILGISNCSVLYSIVNLILLINLIYTMREKNKKVLIPYKLTNILFIIIFVLSVVIIGGDVLENYATMRKADIIFNFTDILRFIYVIFFNIYINLYMNNLMKGRLENE